MFSMRVFKKFHINDYTEFEVKRIYCLCNVKKKSWNVELENQSFDRVSFDL